MTTTSSQIGHEPTFVNSMDERRTDQIVINCPKATCRRYRRALTLQDYPCKTLIGGTRKVKGLVNVIGLKGCQNSQMIDHTEILGGFCELKCWQLYYIHNINVPRKFPRSKLGDVQAYARDASEVLSKISQTDSDQPKSPDNLRRAFHHQSIATGSTTERMEAILTLVIKSRLLPVD